MGAALACCLGSQSGQLSINTKPSISLPEQAIQRLVDNVRRVIVGKDDAVDQAVVCLLCGGHLLLEDVPGVGKTMLAKSLSRSIDAEFKRLQFTPDLLPSDVTGANVFDQEKRQFYFRRGPVFTNVLLADEINRGTPRTQSSLLECMEEGQVSVDGTTYELPKPFWVMATQNPIELQGTYPLPEAQLDRFFMRVSLGYLNLKREVALLKSQAETHPLSSLEPVCNLDEIAALQTRVTAVPVDESLLVYMAQIVQETRVHPDIQLGASPRGTLALRRASQALAVLRERDFVTPQMIKNMAFPVLRHRLVLKPQSRLTGMRADDVLKDVLANIEVPIT
jgi:MoxR-like ATPase